MPGFARVYIDFRKKNGTYLIVLPIMWALLLPYGLTTPPHTLVLESKPPQESLWHDYLTTAIWQPEPPA